MMNDMDKPNNSTNSKNRSSISRRGLLLGGFLASLAATYGLFASYAMKFVFPERKEPRLRRVFLAFASDIPQGDSKSILMPSGDQLLISNTRSIDAETGNTFVAFSNSCPHLGCKVFWEAQAEQFICPCHQGIFDAEGQPVSGPPAQSDSNLKHYRIEVEGNSIYALIEEV
jgi:Rieske Fe-S protein